MIQRLSVCNLIIRFVSLTMSLNVLFTSLSARPIRLSGFEFCHIVIVYFAADAKYEMLSLPSVILLHTPNNAKYDKAINSLRFQKPTEKASVCQVLIAIYPNLIEELLIFFKSFSWMHEKPNRKAPVTALPHSKETYNIMLRKNKAKWQR